MEVKKKMISEKKYVFPILTIIMVIGLAGTAMAVFNDPQAGGEVNTTFVFSINTTNATIPNATDCNISGSSTLTSDSFSLANITNASLEDGIWMINGSVSTAAWLDASDWQFNATCYNGTGAAFNESITAITGMVVNNSIPVCTWANPTANSSEQLPTTVWSVTGTNATAGTIQFGNNTNYTLTEGASNADVFNYTGNKQSIPMTTYAQIRATMNDGLDTKTCDLKYITIDDGIPLSQIAGVAASASAGAGAKASSGFANNNMVFLVIVGLAAFWYVRKKK